MQLISGGCEMNRPFRQVLMTTVILLSALFFGPPAIANDADELTQLLHEFLAGVSDAAMHDRFWAEDLVYTSSAGTRTNKAEIMSGFGESDDGEREDTGPVYAAEDVQVKVYGTTAVVAFRLVATSGDQSAEDVVLNYLNTGTFLKRSGIWQVVAWQATKMSGS